MWHYRSFSQNLESLFELFDIKRDLLLGATKSEVYLDESQSIQDAHYSYLVTRGEGGYILDLDFCKGDLEIRIMSSDEKIVETEMQRARVLVDNIIRIKRNKTRAIA